MFLQGNLGGEIMEKRESKKLITPSNNGYYGNPNKRPSNKSTIQIKIETSESVKLSSIPKKNEEVRVSEVQKLKKEEEKEKKSFSSLNPLQFIKIGKFHKETVNEVKETAKEVKEAINEVKEIVKEVVKEKEVVPVHYYEIEEENAPKEIEVVKKMKKENLKKEESKSKASNDENVKGEPLLQGMTAQDILIDYRRLLRNEQKMSEDILKDVEVKKLIIADVQKEIKEIYDEDVDALEKYLMKEGMHPSDHFFQHNWNNLSEIWRVKCHLNKLQPNVKDLENQIIEMQKRVVGIEVETESKIEEIKKEANEKLKQMEQSLDSTIKENAELEKKAKEAIGNFEKNKQRFKEQDEEIEKLKKDNIQLDLDYKKIQVLGKKERLEKEKALKEKEELEVQLRNLEVRLKEKEEVEDKVKELELEVHMLSEQISLHEGNHEHAKSNEQEIILKNQKLMDELNQKNQEIKIVNQKIKQTVSQLEELKKTNEEVLIKLKGEMDGLKENQKRLLLEKETVEKCDSIASLLKQEFIHPNVKKQLVVLLKERKRNTEQLENPLKQSFPQQKEEGEHLIKKPLESVKMMKSVSEDIKGLITTMKVNQNEIDVYAEMKHEQQAEEKKTIALFKKHGYEVEEERPNEYYIIEPNTMKKAIFVHFDKAIKDEEEYDKIFNKCHSFILSFSNKEDKKLSNRSLGKWLNKQTDSKKKQVQFSLNSEPELMQKPPERLGGL